MTDVLHSCRYSKSFQFTQQYIFVSTLQWKFHWLEQTNCNWSWKLCNKCWFFNWLFSSLERMATRKFYFCIFIHNCLGNNTWNDQRVNKNIVKISIFDHDLKVSAFANDTIFLINNIDSITFSHKFNKISMLLWAKAKCI